HRPPTSFPTRRSSDLSMRRRISAGIVPSARSTNASNLRCDIRIPEHRLLGLLSLLSLLGLPTLPRESLRPRRPSRLSRLSRRPRSEEHTSELQSRVDI